jgi:hypothetical protein
MDGPDFGVVESLEDTLSHCGIKGMKWGQRTSRGGTPASTREPVSEDAQKTLESRSAVKSHGTKTLSTEELQKLVTRMNLEKQFSDLVDKEPGKINDGTKVIKKILSTGKLANEVFTTINSPAAKALKDLLAK